MHAQITSLRGRISTQVRHFTSERMKSSLFDELVPIASKYQVSSWMGLFEKLKRNQKNQTPLDKTKQVDELKLFLDCATKLNGRKRRKSRQGNTEHSSKQKGDFWISRLFLMIIRVSLH